MAVAAEVDETCDVPLGAASLSLYLVCLYSVYIKCLQSIYSSTLICILNCYIGFSVIYICEMGSIAQYLAYNRVQLGRKAAAV